MKTLTVNAARPVREACSAAGSRPRVAGPLAKDRCRVPELGLVIPDAPGSIDAANRSLWKVREAEAGAVKLLVFAAGPLDMRPIDPGDLGVLTAELTG